MSAKINLIYFGGRGRAEVIRLIMAAADIEWTEEHLTDPDRVAQLRNEGLTLFQQFPILQTGDLNLVDSNVIARYLANKHGFVGANLEENTRIDMLTSGARDWYLLGFSNINWNPEEKREVVTKQIMDKSKSRYIPAFEKALKDNGSSGHLVGNKMTLADIALLDVVLWLWELNESMVTQSTELKKFYDKMMSFPSIAKYLQGPGRFPHPDDKYIKDVRHALSF